MEVPAICIDGDGHSSGGGGDQEVATRCNINPLGLADLDLGLNHPVDTVHTKVKGRLSLPGVGCEFHCHSRGSSFPFPQCVDEFVLQLALHLGGDRDAGEAAPAALQLLPVSEQHRELIQSSTLADPITLESASVGVEAPIATVIATTGL